MIRTMPVFKVADAVCINKGVGQDLVSTLLQPIRFRGNAVIMRYYTCHISYQRFVFEETSSAQKIHFPFPHCTTSHAIIIYIYFITLKIKIFSFQFSSKECIYSQSKE